MVQIQVTATAVAVGLGLHNVVRASVVTTLNKSLQPNDTICVLDSLSFQVMTDTPMGINHYLNDIYFMPINHKTQNVASQCYYSMWKN